MRHFCEHPPEGVKICDGWVAREDKITVVFHVDELSAKASELNGSRDPVFWLVDGTFQTNCADLVLPALGPVGLICEDGFPHMRFLPAVFCFCDAEDEDAVVASLEAAISEHKPRSVDTNEIPIE